jgi:NitT/TauT family transport system substrate-binding protein
VIKQGFNVDPLLQKQADCISTMTYNEYWQVIDAGYKPDQLVVFKYSDEGVATLEDGLYAMEPKLKDPAFVAKMAKFVKASEKGWDWAKCERQRSRQDRDRGRHHRRADAAPSGADDGRNRQAPRSGNGKLDPKDYDRTVAPHPNSSPAARIRSSPRSRKAPGRTPSTTR